MRKILTLGAAALCLLVVNWFTFHDFLEPHTVRDYLTLLASVFVFLCFVDELWEELKRIIPRTSRP